MKFTNGYWLTRPEYNIQSPSQYYSHRMVDHALEVFLPYKKINGRNDTLNLGMSTMKVDTPRADVIRISLHHFERDTTERFEVRQYPVNPVIDENESELTYQSGKLTMKLQKADAQLSFIGEKGLLTQSKPKAQGYIKADDGRVFMREQLTLAPDEYVYGLGERFTPFIKNGQVVDIWNQDGGTGSEQAYKNIPFYLTNKGYGVFVNHKGAVSFEVASENVARNQFSVEGESLEYLVIYGPTVKEIIEKYTDLTGKPALPPAWSFGLWLSTSFTTDYSEETVMHFIDGMIKRDIPFDVFHFDCFWMKEFEWCNFLWDYEKFPDPKGMIERIHQKGLKVCLWINPYIGQKSPLFKEAKEKGYFIKSQDGQVWQWDLWQAGQGIVDFTNPDAAKWYQGHLETLLDMGVDSFKTDFGERIPEDGVYFDGVSGKLNHNYYSYLYNQAVFELLEHKKGQGNGIVFARSGSVGSQKFPVHWGGDNLSEYTSMAETLRGGLSFLLSGFGFWSHDIGGFEENTTPDLYKRWTQFGLLSSHSRYHGNIEYRVPWNFGEEAVAVAQKFSYLKNSLMPYLFSEAVATAKTGVSLMRPVFMEFEEDETTFYVDKQYMLGEKMMVAPILTEDGVIRYYLPQGTWTHLLSGEVVKNTVGRWVKEQYDYFSLPLFVRENSILVTKENQKHAEYDYLDNVTISLYQLSEGTHATTVYASDGIQKANVSVAKSETSTRVSLTGFTGMLTVKLYQNNQILEQTVAGETTLEFTNKVG